MTKPIIAVTSNNMNISVNYSSNQNVTLVNNSYINCVNDKNGIPIVIPVACDKDDLHRIASIADGLLLIGGQDVSEETYGKTICDDKSNIFKSDLKRDINEINLYKLFFAMKKPIFGICRGMQLINVAENGTLKNLNEDIVHHSIEKDGWINYHKISILDSEVYNIMKEREYFTSSVHHQGIDVLGNGLKICAVADDGVAEIIEKINEDNFVIGVQGHPENTRNNLKSYDLLFERFIEECNNNDK